MQLTSSSVALITGAGSGLGEATARRLHAQGAHVVLLDLPGSPTATALIEDLGDRAVFAPADVRDEAAVSAAISMATERGALRVVVNCAGVATPGRILGRSGPLALDAFKTVHEINVLGTFNVLRLAAEAMASNEALDGDKGVVVMTASVAAFDGQVGQAAYASSKGAIHSLTLAAARDLASLNIRVMTIAPGVFATPMMVGLGEKVTTSLEALVPHPARLGSPTEYAALVSHIVENPYLNGETIRLDGSLRMPAR